MVSVKADATVALTMLMDRLSWPVKMVRWRAAKEIKKLIESELTRATATAALLRWLAERRFESEVVSALSVFLVVIPEARPKLKVLCPHILKPSLLSEMMVEKMYAGSRCGDWQRAHSGEPPDDFVASKYFENHKAAQVPLIFSNRLRSLEERYELPFMRQWAYEWQNLTNETGAVETKYPSYLGDFGLQRSGIFGQFVQRQSEVYRSAYLRTLAYAVAMWGMPPRLAATYLFHALCILPNFFDVEPGKRPKWLRDLPARCLREGADLEAIGRHIVGAAKNRNRSLVALGTPFPAELAEFGDLTMSAFFVTNDFVPSEGQVFGPDGNYCFPDELGFNAERERLDARPVAGRTGSAISVCAEAHPVFHGFWHDDYFQRGLPLPASYCFEETTIQSADAGGLRILLDGQKVGEAVIWHDAWTPLYGEGSSTRCGVCTTMSRVKLNEVAKRLGMGIGWFVRLVYMHRKESYSDYSPITRTTFFREELPHRD
jgi:hypothetical protein